MSNHPDDNFHPPKDEDPFWTETAWFGFHVPERKLSGQVYPFFRPNQRVAACAVLIWNHQGGELNTALYARQVWHLPMPDSPLTNIQLPNGLHYECLEPRSHFRIKYQDPGGEDVGIDLEYKSIMEPNHDGHGHFDQAGRVTGTIRIDGEDIAVDCFGMRDRSWGRRLEFGRNTVKHGGQQLGYGFATADANHGFHVLGLDKGRGVCEIVHGYYLRDGKLERVRQGVREVLKRDPATGAQTAVRVTGVDDSGRSFEAVGQCANSFSYLMNPNVWVAACLTEWHFDGVKAWGEDHDNWTTHGYRRFFRSFFGYDKG